MHFGGSVLIFLYKTVFFSIILLFTEKDMRYIIEFITENMKIREF